MSPRHRKPDVTPENWQDAMELMQELPRAHRENALQICEAMAYLVREFWGPTPADFNEVEPPDQPD